MDRRSSTLFLHGGPGLSSGVERLWFGDALPICWWDQPLIADRSSSAFGQLVEAATGQLRMMANQSSQPVALIVHSFGAQIALELVRRVPELIQDLTVLGSGPNPVASLFVLCRRLTEIHSTPELEAAIGMAQRQLNRRNFESMILLAAQHPAYPSVYFGPNSIVRDRFLSLLPQTRPLDLETFFNVMDDFLHTPDAMPMVNYGGKVKIVLGLHDPLMPVAATIENWRRLFPQLSSEVLNCAHFIHLEAHPGSWFEADHQYVA